MLTIPSERIALLLERASEVWNIPARNVSEDEPRRQTKGVTSELIEGLAETPAYRELTVMVEELDPEEIYELLALAAIGDSDDLEEAWEIAVQHAETIAIEDAASELARLLVLTDSIETGLDRLEYFNDVEDEDGDEDEMEREKTAETDADEEEDADEETKLDSRSLR